MKKTISTIRLSSALTASALLLTGNALMAEPSHPSVEDYDFSPVFNPDVPASVNFCGKSIKLDRADMYERFDRELASLAYTHGSTLLMIKRANKYFPRMAEQLKKNGMPLDLLYLACVESSLNPRAYSPAKAAGFWQFIPSTAKQYGLEVNDEVDERYDIDKATAAAARYFRDGLAKYGDWPSVMAAFNAGFARITGELDKQLADNSFDLYLNEETSRYVFRILAMKTILENPAAYGYHLEADQLYYPTECDVVEVSGPVADWPVWAKEHGISYAQLREENPWIRAKSLTNKSGKTYKVRIPRADSLYRSKQNKNVYNPNWVK